MVIFLEYKLSLILTVKCSFSNQCKLFSLSCLELFYKPVNNIQDTCWTYQLIGNSISHMYTAYVKLLEDGRKLAIGDSFNTEEVLVVLFCVFFNSSYRGNICINCIVRYQCTCVYISLL